MFNPLKVLSAVLNFFKRLFGPDGENVKKALEAASSYIKLAQPVVNALAQIARDLPQDKFLQEVQKVLAVYVPDSAKVVAFAASTSGLSGSKILQEAAFLALSALVPGAKASVLNFAIETAVQILKVAL